MKSSNKESGFTLIEILIALVIAVISLTAIFLLIMGTLRQQQESEFKRNAVTISVIIADKMRANTENAARYDSFRFVDPATHASENRIGADKLKSPTELEKAANDYYAPGKYKKACDGKLDLGGCTENDIAMNDMIFWQSVIKDSLPGGVGLVRRVEFKQGGADVPTQNLYQIMIMWRESTDKSGEAPLDPECNFPTVEEKAAWDTSPTGAPDPDKSFRNYRCKVVTVSI